MSAKPRTVKRCTQQRCAMSAVKMLVAPVSSARAYAIERPSGENAGAKLRSVCVPGAMNDDPDVLGLMGLEQGKNRYFWFEESMESERKSDADRNRRKKP